MSDGSLGTFTKSKNLLRTSLSATEFVGLCQLYGFEGVTNAWLSRTLKSGKLNHDTDKTLRHLILRIEDLIERARPFPVAFENSEHIKLLLDVISDGANYSVDVNLIPFAGKQ
jgi:hypothetical protein